MTFTGLSASTLLSIGAAMGALTLALYILKLRRRAVSVPFAPIWERVLRDKQSTHLFSQLKRWLSLLLQLCLVALMVLALGDPRLSAGILEGRNMVVLVDTSASMQATDVSPSRIDVARKKLLEMAQGLSSSDRMLIAELGPAPHPRSTFTGDVSQLTTAIEGLRPTDTVADLERGLRFALDSLRGLSKPEIIIVSDGAHEDTERVARRVDTSGVQLRFVPVGVGSRNVAITQFSVRRYPLDKSSYEVLIEVANTNETPAELELTLVGDGAVVDVTTLRLGPNERLPRIYSDLAGASHQLEAQIRLLGDAQDQLAADDRAYALMPERRRARVLVVSSGNTYLQAALLLDEFLDVSLADPSQPIPNETFDVTVLDGVAPRLSAQHGALLYLDPPAEGAPIGHRQRRTQLRDFGFDTWEKKSPLLAFIAPENIQVAVGNALAPGPDDKVVGASEQGPFFVTGSRDGQRFAALGFDPRNSDFVLRVAWPVFLLNAINTFVQEDVRYLSSFRTGEVWHIPAPGDAAFATLRTPSGSDVIVPVKNGFATTFGEHAGFYQLLGEQDAIVHTFAANLSNLQESRIEPRAELVLGSTNATAIEGFSKGARREVWTWLLLGVLAVSLLEWFSYHRRITV